jgi:5-methyltetrahydropteroyltriglutamate--homocysteine methyltransferase
MSLPTTCIGAYPKPDYLPVRDWFTLRDGMTAAGAEVTRDYSQALSQADDAELEALFVRATEDAVRDQTGAGIDVPTDGEQRRENYIHYHCRHLRGVDFETLTPKVLRDGAYETDLPTIVGKVLPMPEHFLSRDFEVAQGATERPVKITAPGPLTIMDTTADSHYGDRRALAFDLAAALNFEILGLAAAGCRYIQVDEPVFARNVKDALAFGIEALERCFDGVPEQVTRVLHMCCGYPNHLDDTQYQKADPQTYFALAEAVDGSSVDQVSIEDAHRHNDLVLLERFPRSTIVLGAVAIASSRLEGVEEIVDRARRALEHIDRDRLVLAPDCGLGFLARPLALEKLGNLCAAARVI